MRLKTSGSVRRIDLQAAQQLLPPLVDEWARLTFGPDGAVVNPITGGPHTALVLVEGRHRQAGTRYAVTIETPTIEVPPDPGPEAGGSADDDLRRIQELRRREAGITVGAERTTLAVVVRADDSRRLAVTVGDEGGNWSVEVDIEHGPLPRIELVGRVDLTALVRGAGAPGCLAGFLGGPAHGTATIDPSALAGGRGTLLDATGSMKRFGGTARAEVETSSRAWRVDGAVSVRASGLGRIALLVAGRRVRRQAAQALQQCWESSETWIGGVEDDLRELSSEIERAGGPEPFVHRALWDADYRDSAFPTH